MTSFIGIDLAWQGDKNHSGGAVLTETENGLELCALSSGMHQLADVLEFIKLHSAANTVVAVDAPLILTNLDKQRPCEGQISSRFGAAHASAHSTNLTKYPNAASVRLARALQNAGFQHCPMPHTRKLPGRWFFEVYPHPAHVVLFNRTRIVKYKKGRVPERRRGLKEFREAISLHCASGEPRLVFNRALSDLLGDDLDVLRGAALKNYEDLLDATFCAYLAAHFWTWSLDRNEMIGDLKTGYVVNPLPSAQQGVAADGLVGRA